MNTLALLQLSRRYARLACLTLVTILSVGCAQFSKEECATGDWQTRGAADGKRGLIKLAQFNKYAATCQKEHGIELRSEAYFAGYDEGLPLFCTESNGRSLGGKGAKYWGVCTPALEPAFMAGYDKGLESFCTAGNGARFAGRRSQYNGVCPATLQREFLSGYVPGLEASLPTLESDLFHYRRELSGLESDLAIEKIELRHQRSELSRTNKKSREYRKRTRIVDRIRRDNRHLESDIRTMQDRVKHLESDHTVARQQINTWRPLMHQ